ncbi:GUN4 domain-containing protein [Saccharothrix sp. NPDC042600]|uniref:GUN4 domain-containing protein n=1 Tax=Saccharothrix TaxID=2071 RepID=UPI0033FB3EE9|nr:hypothetical protein GCM10017745_21200 [Saccharothrix mutabilis subsp. capreolus]
MALVERFVLGVDVKDSSALPARVQHKLYEELDRMLDEASARVGLDRSAWTRQPGGDGEVAVLPADVDLVALVGDFVLRLDRLLTDHNEISAPAAQLRVRLAMHTGALTPSKFGFAGPALVTLARLLDSKPVRAALDAAPTANMAQIISESLFHKAVAAELDGLRPRQFRQVRVDVKTFHETAYVHVPGGPHPPPQGSASEAPRDSPLGPPRDSPLGSSQGSPLGPSQGSPLGSSQGSPPLRPGRGSGGLPPFAPGLEPLITIARRAGGQPGGSAGVEPVRQPEPAVVEPPELGEDVRRLLADLGAALGDRAWERADALTTAALLTEADRVEEGWLRSGDGAKLTDRLLTELDAAWSRHSGGAWGFRAQLEGVGGTSAAGYFRSLSTAFGWRADDDGTDPPYAEFGRRADRSRPFYPTLRNPDRERFPEWHDEWSDTVVATHGRLRSWAW